MEVDKNEHDFRRKRKEMHIRRREGLPTMFMPFMRKGIMSGSVVLKESLPVTIYGRILIHITRLIA